MLKLKTIQLYPSEFDLDCILINNKKQEESIKFFMKRYGLTYDEIANDIKDKYSFSGSFFTSSNAEIPNTRRLYIVIDLRTKDLLVELVHELIHILWFSSRYFGVEISYESQEWQALYVDSLFKQLKDFKSYETIIK